MFKAVQVFRATFETSYGSSSTLIAVESLGDVEDAVNEYKDKTGGKFIKFEDECVMTPHLYVKNKET